jgi:hypothetical protein
MKKLLFLTLLSFTTETPRLPKTAKAVAMVQVAPDDDPYVKVYFAWVDSLNDPSEALDTAITFHKDSLPKMGEIIEIKQK